MVEKLASSFSFIYIIIDGLDEWVPPEQELTLDALLKLGRSLPATCKLLIASRRTQSITKMLNQYPMSCLDDYPELAQTAISSFIKPPLDQLRPKFSSAIIDRLTDEILRKANG